MATGNQVARRPQQSQAVAQPTAGMPAWMAQIEQEMQAQGIEKVGEVGDMGSARIPRISVNGGVFAISFGKDDSVTLGDGNSVIMSIVQTVGKYDAHRRLFDKPYDPQDPEPGNLVCWSTNSKAPDDTVTTKQSVTCQNCPSFKACGASWPALVWVMDEAYVGPALWSMNFNTRRNAPVLPTFNKSYHPSAWFSVDQLLEQIAKNPNIGVANLMLRVEFDKGRDVVKGKCIVSVLGSTPQDHLDGIKAIDSALFDVVFRPVITPRANHEIDGEVALAQHQPAARPAPARQAQPAPARGPAPAQQVRGPARLAPPAQVEEAEIVDGPAPAPRQAAPARGPAPAARPAPRQMGVPPGTEDDFPQQAPAPARVARPAPHTQAPRGPAPAPQAPRGPAPAAPRGPAPLAGRGPARAPGGPLAARPRPAPQAPAQGYETMDDAGSDAGYDYDQQ